MSYFPGKAVWFEETGLVHGYLRARHSVGRASESFARIVGALERELVDHFRHDGVGKAHLPQKR